MFQLIKILPKILLLIILNFTLYINILSDEFYNDKNVAKIELIFPQADYWNQLVKNKETEADMPAMLIVNDSIIFDSVGVRFKGNSSYNIPNDKKSFNISIDAYKDSYRLFGYKTLNLNNCFVDPTFCREKISNEIVSKYMPAPATGFVQLYINGTYWGLYSNVEQINKIFLNKWFSSNKGNLYKGDPKGNLIWKGNDPDLYKSDYEKKTNEKEDNWSDLVTLIDILNNSTNLKEELPKVLDIDRTTWYLALCNILVNLDSYIFSGHNYYLYNDPDAQQFNFLNWDMNESFGVFPPQMNNKERFELINDKNPNLPILKVILGIPEFKEVYLAHYRTILQKSFNTDSIIGRVIELQNLIDLSVRTDQKKLYSYNDFKKNVNEDVFVQGRLVPGLASFIQKRRAYLQGLNEMTREIPILKNLKISNQKPFVDDTISFTVFCESSLKIKNVYLLYKIGISSFEKIKMFDDGLHNDDNENDGKYGVSIVIPKNSEGATIYYYSIAENIEGTLKFEPEEAEFQVYKAEIQSSGKVSKLMINEFMADNKKTIMNEEEKYSDWIELYNPNNYEVNLKGMYLSDDSMKITKWTFPDTTISAKGYILIWADESNSNNGLHANFKLSKEGEYIGLYSDDKTHNVLIDSYEFKAQLTDISEGRYPNGIGNFVYMDTPTPNKENIYETSIIENYDANINYLIYPNPAEKYIIIKSNVGFDISNNIEIINIYGFKLKDINISNLDANSILIDLKLLASGLYNIRIFNKNIINSYKLIIIK